MIPIRQFAAAPVVGQFLPFEVERGRLVVVPPPREKEIASRCVFVLAVKLHEQFIGGNTGCPTLRQIRGHFEGRSAAPEIDHVRIGFRFKGLPPTVAEKNVAGDHSRVALERHTEEDGNTR